MLSHKMIRRALQQPTTFPASFDYQILEYLLSKELLTLCSVARAWHQSAITLFWDRIQQINPATQTDVELKKDKSSQIALSRELINCIAFQNSYSIFRIDRLLEEGAELTTNYPGTLCYNRTDRAEQKKITYKNATPLAVALCLAEEQGPYGAAIVKHIMQKTFHSDEVWDQINGRREQIALHWRPHIAAFIQEQWEEKLRAEHGDDDDDWGPYEMSTTEERLVYTCIGLTVLAIPVVIACSILAPPLITLSIICPFWYLSLILLCCCSGMEVFRFVPFKATSTLFCIALISSILTAMVGPTICSAIAIGLGVLVGLYMGVEYIKYRNEIRRTQEEIQKRKEDAEHFHALAQSAKCQIEPIPLDTFSGGLLLTMSIWKQKMRNINKNAKEEITESTFQNMPRPGGLPPIGVVV